MSDFHPAPTAPPPHPVTPASLPQQNDAHTAPYRLFSEKKPFLSLSRTSTPKTAITARHKTQDDSSQDFHTSLKLHYFLPLPAWLLLKEMTPNSVQVAIQPRSASPILSTPHTSRAPPLQLLFPWAPNPNSHILLSSTALTILLPTNPQGRQHFANSSTPAWRLLVMEKPFPEQSPADVKKSQSRQPGSHHLHAVSTIPGNIYLPFPW